MSRMTQTAYIHMIFTPNSNGSIGIKMLIWNITIYPGSKTIAQHKHLGRVECVRQTDTICSILVGPSNYHQHGAGVQLNFRISTHNVWPWEVISWKYLSYASAVFSSSQLPTAILYQLVQSILCKENKINCTEISGTNWDSNRDLLWVNVRFPYYKMLLSVVKTWVGPGCTY